MTFLSRHSSLRKLSRFADGEAREAEAREVQRHLAECERCRDELSFLLELRRAAREISHPSPPKGTLEEILRRRARGERVILPMSTPPARRTTPGLAGLVALLLAVGTAAAFLLLGVGEASAGASTLEIGPERPQLGQPLEMEFRAASALASEPRVVLSGRYRTAEGGPILPDEPLGAPFRQDLERSGEGVFAGTAWLPPTAVYAAFVVESPDGSRLETDAGRPWEVLAHDEEGRPAFAALEQRFRVMEALNRLEAMRETAERMTALYPDEPEGWWFRLTLEKRLAGPEEAARIEAEHRSRLPWLERAVSRLEGPGGDRLEALAEYAKRLGEEEAAALWRRHLLDEYPRHPRAQRLRVESIVAASRRPSSDPGEHLRAFELEWDRAGAMDRFFLNVAFQTALATGDPDQVRKWAERYVHLQPESFPGVVEKVMSVPELRGWGMEWIRGRLARLEPPGAGGRRLLHSREEHGQALEERRRYLLLVLGKALLKEGRREAALDTLALAAAGSWRPDLLAELAPLQVAAGDTAGGLALFGVVAADPVADPAQVRAEAAAALGKSVPEQRWKAFVESGRADVRRRVRRAPVRWPALGGPIRVLDGRDAEVRLEERLEGRVSLLAFWMAGLHEAEALSDLAPRLEGAGGRVLSIWADRPGAAEASLVPGPALRDARREASEAFGAWARPSYVVLDEQGRIRYEGGNVDDAFRHALVLAQTAEAS